MNKPPQIPQQIEEEMRETVYPHLRVLTGGKEPPQDPPGPTDNWLADYPDGTIFLTRNKKNRKDFVLGEYEIVNRSKVSVMLYSGINSPPVVRVDTKQFSEDMDLVEVLRYGKAEEKTDDTDECDRPD